MTEKELLKKQEEIEQAKSQFLQLTGKEQQLKEQLKDNWNCETLQDAKKKINTFRKNINDIEEKINELTSLLEIKLEQIEQDEQ